MVVAPAVTPDMRETFQCLLSQVKETRMHSNMHCTLTSRIRSASQPEVFDSTKANVGQSPTLISGVLSGFL